MEDRYNRQDRIIKIIIYFPKSKTISSKCLKNIEDLAEQILFNNSNNNYYYYFINLKYFFILDMMFKKYIHNARYK